MDNSSNNNNNNDGALESPSLYYNSHSSPLPNLFPPEAILETLQAPPQARPHDHHLQPHMQAILETLQAPPQARPHDHPLQPHMQAIFETLQAPHQARPHDHLLQPILETLQTILETLQAPHQALLQAILDTLQAPPQVAPPAPLSIEEKWTRRFADMHTYAAFIGGIPLGIATFGLLGAKAFGVSEICNPTRYITHKVMFQAFLALFFLGLSCLIALGMKTFVGRLSEVQLGQQRLRLCIGYFAVGLTLIIGVTIYGLMLMDFVQIRLGVWSCGSSYIQAIVLIYCFLVVFGDYYLLRCIHGVVSTQ